VEEKRTAVLALLAGKATVDQLARQYGVHADTIEKWREAAMAGVEASLRSGGVSPRERELERENNELRSVVTTLSIDRELLKREVTKHKGPTKPGKSRG
jgi:transposase-like protein